MTDPKQKRRTRKPEIIGKAQLHESGVEECVLNKTQSKRRIDRSFYTTTVTTNKKAKSTPIDNKDNKEKKSEKKKEISETTSNNSSGVEETSSARAEKERPYLTQKTLSQGN